MLKDMKCPCGRDGKYVQIIDGDEVYSCNKYRRCKTYEQLEDELSKQKEQLLTAIQRMEDYPCCMSCYLKVEEVRAAKDMRDNMIRVLKEEMGL